MVSMLMIIAGIVIAGLWLAAVGLLGYMARDMLRDEDTFSKFLGAFIALLATLILIGPPALIANPPPSRPCVAYTDGMMYDPALKMSRPMRYCAEYGEWTDNK